MYIDIYSSIPLFSLFTCSLSLISIQLLFSHSHLSFLLFSVRHSFSLSFVFFHIPIHSSLPSPSPIFLPSLSLSYFSPFLPFPSLYFYLSSPAPSLILHSHLSLSPPFLCFPPLYFYIPLPLLLLLPHPPHLSLSSSSVFTSFLHLSACLAT